MVDDTNAKSKQITLRKLGTDPSRDYQVWAFAARLAFEAEGLDGIIDGKDTDPTPLTGDGEQLVINAALQARINKWKRDHGRVKDAIIQALETEQIYKIWGYGNALNLNSAFHLISNLFEHQKISQISNGIPKTLLINISISSKDISVRQILIGLLAVLLIQAIQTYKL